MRLPSILRPPSGSWLDPPRASDEPTVAFFDMDRTVLTVNSASLWLRFERDEGRLSSWDMLVGLYWMFQYHLGLLDVSLATERALSRSTGDDVADLQERVERWYHSKVRPTISDAAVARIEEHRTAGHDIALLTASTQFGAGMVADEIGIEHLVCTRLEVDGDGRLTGRLDGPLCYGYGKLEQAQAFAAKRGAELATAWFYSDSYSDLPLMELVGHPVAVNPDPRLARHARRAGWPMVRFD